MRCTVKVSEFKFIVSYLRDVRCTKCNEYACFTLPLLQSLRRGSVMVAHWHALPNAQETRKAKYTTLRKDWKAKYGGKAAANNYLVTAAVVDSLASTLATVHTWVRNAGADCNFQHSVRLSGVDLSLSEAGPVSSSCLATLPPTVTELHVSGGITLQSCMCLEEVHWLAMWICGI
jgi:hypothetical protein